MSKLSSEILGEAVDAILAYSTEKKRNFLETIELQIALKNYDPKKDKRLNGSVRLPHVPRPNFVVTLIGNAKDIETAKMLNVPYKSAADLKKLNKNKKLVKKLAASSDAFLASAALIRQIPRLLGPGLNKAGKFPTLYNSADNLALKCDDIRASAKFVIKSKKTFCLGLAVGNVGMTKEEIELNITMAVNYLVSLLTKNWQQVKRLYIKSTMGPSQRIFGF
jgi:large subunit ribosomal protein L10Ae